jgi:hypothetical protein
MGATVMMGKMRFLVRARFPEAEDAFNELADKIDAAYKKKRNVIAHQLMGATKSKTKIRLYTIKASGKKLYEERQVTSEDIRQWAVEFYELGKQITSLLRPYGFESDLINFKNLHS